MKLQVVEALKTLGIHDAFVNQLPPISDFSGMADPEKTPLFISEVIHKAFIETNEEGTKAAAATEIMMYQCCSGGYVESPQVILSFHADHPFLYVLTNNKNDILFVGTVSKFN